MLCLSEIFEDVAYILTLNWNANENLVGCMISGVMFHYFLINRYLWMLSLIVLRYILFKEVFVVIENYFLRSSIIAFGKYKNFKLGLYYMNTCVDKI